MPINYIGEHLLPGILGKSFIWFGFATALAATIFYWIEYRKTKTGFSANRWARNFYYLHSAFLVAVAGVLYYLILNHYFEYSYVWQYSSKELQLKYIISCFWAGQEGSFLVWAISQAIIGVILLHKARNWEAPVMVIFSLSQAFVTSMLLGVKIGGMTIGASPFNLLRETVGQIEGTIFTMPDYVRMITDGNGLNPLLENIWMTIHPPVLFIGYALTLVPFSYAIASLMRHEYHSWINRAFPWALIALFTLGAGILLGGAWAYVSLTFGGFWAWDPVENSSLVPWMTLVAGLHFMIISRRQNFAALATYILMTLTYVLVLYASFLTRSGVLAETSAHSFGDSGMSGQLLIFLITFFVIMVVMIAMHARRINTSRADMLLSREFWMFIGSLVIVLSAFQIIFTTSIPVVNKVLGTEFAPPSDAIGFYNRWQTPYVLLIAGFIAFSQFLLYGSNIPGRFFRKGIFPLGVAAILTVPLVLGGIVRELNFILLVFFIMFALVASVFNMILVTSKPKNFPAVITHIGFALFLLGAVVTFSNSTVISKNTSSYDLGDPRSNAENLMLMKGDTVYMSGYFVTYCSSRQEGNTTHYRVDFLKKRGAAYAKEFSLHPSVNSHPKMGAVYNPDTRRFADRDFYTYIATVSRDPDYIVIRAIMNPYINILWVGSVVMLAGFILAFIRRMRNIRRVRG